jgi:hypothetical protein
MRRCTGLLKLKKKKIKADDSSIRSHWARVAVSNQYWIEG